MRAMPHSEAEAQLSAAAAGALSPEEDRRLSAHLEGCAECSEELAALRELVSGLRSLPTPQPSNDLVARVRRQLALELAARADDRLSLLVVVFLLLFSWTATLAGFVVFRLLSGGGLSLVSALSGPGARWSVSYFLSVWVGGAAAVVLLTAYERRRRMA